LTKEIFAAFTAIINQFNGTVKDYAGDAVYAFWDHQVGEPEKQALLACQAAIRQMQDLDRVLDKLSGEYAGVENIRMGWGITTGPVTMSHYGSRVADLAMVGDCINLAFRLSEIANKELPEIVICSQTARLVLNELQVKDLGEFPIRGRKGTEQLFTIG
jgi:adenylate cyclase